MGICMSLGVSATIKNNYRYLSVFIAFCFGFLPACAWLFVELSLPYKGRDTYAWICSSSEFTMCFTNSYRLCATHKHALTCLSTTNQKQANHASYKPHVQGACTEEGTLKKPLLPQWQVHVSTVLTAELEPVVHTMSSEQKSTLPCLPGRQ